MDRLVASFILLTVTGTSLVFGTLDCDTSCMLSNQFDLEINVDGSDIDLRWTFNQSKPIYGFQMLIYNNDNDVTYESPILHSSERSMSFEHELEGKTNICLVVFENSTEILDKKCEKHEVKDLKVIIGILAGTIFLIPCMAGLTYIVYKDYKIKFVDQYKKIDPELEIKRNKIETVVDIEKERVAEKTDKNCASNAAVENKAFVNDKVIEKERVTEKTDKNCVSSAAVENKAFVNDEVAANADQQVSDTSVETLESGISEETDTENKTAKESKPVETLNRESSKGTDLEDGIAKESNTKDDNRACSDKDSGKTDKIDNLCKDSDDNGRQAPDNLEESNHDTDTLKVDTDNDIDNVTDDEVSGTTL